MSEAKISAVESLVRQPDGAEKGPLSLCHSLSLGSSNSNGIWGMLLSDSPLASYTVFSCTGNAAAFAHFAAIPLRSVGVAFGAGNTKELLKISKSGISLLVLKHLSARCFVL